MKKLLFSVSVLCFSLLPVASQMPAAAFWQELKNPILSVSPNAHFFWNAVVGRSGRAYAYIGYAYPDGTKKSMVLTSQRVMGGVADWKECPYFTQNEVIEKHRSAKRIRSWDVSLDDKLYVCEDYRLHELSDPLGEGRILFEIPHTNKLLEESKECIMPEEKMLAVHKSSDGTLFLITSYAIYKSVDNYGSFDRAISFENPCETDPISNYNCVYISSNYDRTQAYVIVNYNSLSAGIFDLTAGKELSSEKWTSVLKEPAVDDNGNLYFSEWAYSSGHEPRYIVMYDKEKKAYNKRQVGDKYITPDRALHLEGIDPYSFLIDRSGYIYMFGLDNREYDTPNYVPFANCGLWVGKLGETDWLSLPLIPLAEDKTFYGQLIATQFLGIDKDGYYYLFTHGFDNLNHLLVSALPHPSPSQWMSIVLPATAEMQAHLSGGSIVISSPDDLLVGEVSIYNMSGIRVARKEVSNTSTVRIGCEHLPAGVYLIGATGMSGKRLIAKFLI